MLVPLLVKVAGVVAGLGVTVYSVIGSLPSNSGALKTISTLPLLNALFVPLFVALEIEGASGTDFLEEAGFPMGLVIRHSDHQ